MGLPLREALRQLCLDYGWSYAVSWKVAVFQNRMHLVWEDGYYNRKPSFSSFKISISLPKQEALGIKSYFSELACEADDPIKVLVDKIMASQVHFVGDGLVGQAASSGKYVWINKHRFGSMYKGLAELNCQFAARTQTIIIVPVLPYGVIQLGSTQMVTESMGFIHYIRSLFTKILYNSKDLLSVSTQKSLTEECQTYASCRSTFGSQSTNACLNVDDRLNVTSDWCNPESLKPLAPRSISEYVQPCASQLVPTKQAVKMAYPIRKLILQSADGIFHKPDMQRTQQVLVDDANPRCQNKHPISNSVSPSNTTKVLEELMFTSGVRPLESANNVFEIGNINSSSNSHRVTKCLSSSTKLSLSGTPPNLDQRSHALRLQSTCTSEVTMDHPFSCDEVAYTQSNAEVKENGDSVQASHICSGESSVQVSYFDMFPSVLQECTIPNLKPVQSDQTCKNVDYEENACAANSIQRAQNLKEYKCLPTSSQTSSSLYTSNDDMFHMADVNRKTYWINDSLADVVHKNFTNACNFIDLPSLPAETDVPPIFDSLNENISYAGSLSMDNSNQLLDAVISKINPGVRQRSESNSFCRSTLTDPCSANCARTPNHGEVHLAKLMKDEFVDFAPLVVKTESSCICYSRSSCSIEKDRENNHESGLHKSQISPWVDSCPSARNDCVSGSTSKRVLELGKLNRKRSRPGESPRPRPKDRQMIQDRIKELREIIPNGAKCSIDALLEKTIEHMLFLHNVTKHAEKLKVAGEPKIGTDQGGATWAFELGTRPVTCPIVVQDLNPPRQLFIEMLCEKRGSFLEIADFIRGLGLTILKGVMEAHKNQVWARFAVESNRDVTRMVIFLKLVQQLAPSAGSNMGLPNAGAINMPRTLFQPATVPERAI